MNPLQMLMQNPQQLFQQVNNFAQQLQQQSKGMTPQQMVQNMLNQGKLSQADFNRYREITNKLTGLNN